jgi:hypothetical protein
MWNVNYNTKLQNVLKPTLSRHFPFNKLSLLNFSKKTPGLAYDSAAVTVAKQNAKDKYI